LRYFLHQEAQGARYTPRAGSKTTHRCKAGDCGVRDFVLQHGERGACWNKEGGQDDFKPAWKGVDIIWPVEIRESLGAIGWAPAGGRQDNRGRKVFRVQVEGHVELGCMIYDSPRSRLVRQQGDSFKALVLNVFMN